MAWINLADNSMRWLVAGLLVIEGYFTVITAIGATWFVGLASIGIGAIIGYDNIRKK